ncbi:hypothetical protein [Streptosporangium canum]|uniref:hypothetical protein n=1 Tax=Streptosporangium canum TaxID=324952 RepID=UPI0037B71765
MRNPGHPGEFFIPSTIKVRYTSTQRIPAEPGRSFRSRREERNFTRQADAANDSSPQEIIICDTCKVPLSRRTNAPGTLTETVEHIHPSRPQPFDHEPVPVASLPSGAVMICDFCGTPNPGVVFVPNTKKAVIERIVTEDVIQSTDLSSSPWAACDTCSAFLEKRQLHLLLDRVVHFLSSRYGLSRPERKAIRAYNKKRYAALFKTGLAGPFPLEGQR